MFMYGLLFSYFVWIPMLVVLGALGVCLVVRSVGAPMWMRRSAACVACGYELTSLADGRCSECGAHLLKVGITTPRLAVRLRGSMFLLVVGWTFTAGALTAPVLGYIGWLSSVRQMNQMMAGGGTVSGPCSMSCTLVPNRAEGLDAPAYTIDFDASMITDDSDNIQSGQLLLRFINTPNAVTVSVDLLNKTWELTADSGAAAADGVMFSSSDAMRIYREAGLDVTNASIQSELGYLTTSVDSFWYSPEWNSPDLFVPGSPLVAENLVSDWSQSGPSQTSSPFGGFNPYNGLDLWGTIFLGVSALAFILYLVGLVLLILKRRRLLQSPALA